jgi:hypothetical protein
METSTSYRALPEMSLRSLSEDYRTTGARAHDDCTGPEGAQGAALLLLALIVRRAVVI